MSGYAVDALDAMDVGEGDLPSLSEAAYHEAVETLYEDRLSERVEAMLAEHAASFRAEGFRVAGPYDLTDDTYRWAITLSGNGLPESVDVMVEVAESLEYEGTTEGVNFGYTITAEGGRVIGGLTPFNFTADVWVDLRDTEALEDRFRIIEECSVDEAVSLLLGFIDRDGNLTAFDR